jgi:hypothetical protein
MKDESESSWTNSVTIRPSSLPEVIKNDDGAKWIWLVPRPRVKPSSCGTLRTQLHRWTNLHGDMFFFPSLLRTFVKFRLKSFECWNEDVFNTQDVYDTWHIFTDFHNVNWVPASPLAISAHPVDRGGSKVQHYPRLISQSYTLNRK